jgi:hypothetical protein
MYIYISFVRFVNYKVGNLILRAKNARHFTCMLPWLTLNGHCGLRCGEHRIVTQTPRPSTVLPFIAHPSPPLVLKTSRAVSDVYQKVLLSARF